MDEITKAIQTEFDKRPRHFFSFDLRFCGKDLSRPRPVAATDEQVTCKFCLMKATKLKAKELGLEL